MSVSVTPAVAGRDVGVCDASSGGSRCRYLLPASSGRVIGTNSGLLSTVWCRQVWSLLSGLESLSYMAALQHLSSGLFFIPSSAF